jgi:hypothetical protein
MSRKLSQLALAAALLAASGNVRAEERQIELSSTIQLVNTTQEGEALSPATSVVPGDQLEFFVSYRNLTGEPITDFVIVSPVSTNVVISAETASRLDVSIDGGRSFGLLPSLQVAAGDGSQRPATAADVTHLRWTIPSMAPGAGGQVQYRASVK